jgi:superfamily I DNA/RNA helicase
VIVDEVQDLGPQELLLLAALVGTGPDCLTLVGDGGQRIYGRPISFQALGIDVRGRSHVLCLNYRTTEQIHRFAERILHGSADDLDGGRDDQRTVRSLIGGPEPTTQGFTTSDEQTRFVVSQIDRHLAEGLQPEDIAIFAPKKDLLDPIKVPLQAAGRHYHILSATKGEASGINLGTMHGAKGLEFKVVFVIDVSDGHVPPAWIYWGTKDPQAREEALQREMQLLYVSVTRARDEVYLTWVGKRSRFLEGPSTTVEPRT